MTKFVDESMVDMCKEEGLSHKQVFFCFSLLFGFIVMSYLNIIFVSEKDSLQCFDAGILRVEHSKN